MKRSFETVMVEQCAPTLAGVKPASLFRFQSSNVEEIRSQVNALNQTLRPMGLRVVILKECLRTNACVIYLYRQAWVDKILQDADNRAFLQRMGYQETGTAGMLRQLSRRLCLEQDFPHEVGVFLGYPLQDVVGFIENRGWNYTCCGCWKAYSDPEEAQKRFDCYRKCTSKYKELLARGTPVIQLVVAA